MSEIRGFTGGPRQGASPSPCAQKVAGASCSGSLTFGRSSPQQPRRGDAYQPRARALGSGCGKEEESPEGAAHGPSVALHVPPLQGSAWERNRPRTPLRSALGWYASPLQGLWSWGSFPRASPWAGLVCPFGAGGQPQVVAAAIPAFNLRPLVLAYLRSRPSSAQPRRQLPSTPNPELEAPATFPLPPSLLFSPFPSHRSARPTQPGRSAESPRQPNHQPYLVFPLRALRAFVVQKRVDGGA
jgi:hypothetical protein